VIERTAVCDIYVATQHDKAVAGRVDFVARVADAAKGYDLAMRAKGAVAGRLRIRVADVNIVVVEST